MSNSTHAFSKNSFWNYRNIELNPIHLVDDTIHAPQRKWSVKVSLPRIWQKWISNVWYVPTFRKNLWSLVTIRQAEHQIIIQDGIVEINFKNYNLNILMIGYEDGKLLRMKGTIISRNNDFVGIVKYEISSFRLWHSQFGHWNFDSLITLKYQELVKGFPTLKKGKG